MSTIITIRTVILAVSGGIIGGLILGFSSVGLGLMWHKKVKN